MLAASTHAFGQPWVLHFYVHCPNCLAGFASVLQNASSAFFSSFALRDTRRIAVKVGVPTSSLCLSASQHVNSRRDLGLNLIPHRFLRSPYGSCNVGDWRKHLGTWAPVKWSDAMNYCAKYGKTLCGSSDSARCQNSGCYYNSIYQWTNEPCEPDDEGYECTTP